VDPRRFDDLIQRLAQRRSRRSLVGGSLGASVLAALGLGEEVLARKDGVSAEACIPSGKKCPAKKPRGKKAKKLGCKQCCQRFSIGGRKGNRKCSCKPVGQPCTTDRASDCCTGICDGSFCANSPVAPQCTPLGTSCTGFAPACCSGVCNRRGSNVNTTANECAPCRTGGAFCQGEANSCCDGRACLVIADARDVCCSLPDEACTPGLGVCCPLTPGLGGTLCPAAGVCPNPAVDPGG
jgi:hypothetical protein